MKEKRLTGKRKYFGDYHRDSSGEFVYTGKYYRINVPPEKFARIRLIYSFLALATMAAFLLAGLLNNQGSRVIYVVLPYAALFLPLAFMLSDVYKIVTLKGGMTQEQYDHSVVQLKHVSIAAILLSFISLAGDIVFILTGCGAEYLMRELLFLTACIVIFILNLIFIAIQRKVVCITPDA